MPGRTGLPLVLGFAALLAACSSETVERTDSQDERAAEQPDEAGAHAPEPREANPTVSALEEVTRGQYAERFFEIRSFGVREQGPGLYGGIVGLYDSLLARETQVECRFEVSNNEIADANCEDVDPAAARTRTTRGDVVIATSDEAGMREELVREMQSNLGGQNRTSTPTHFSGDGGTFVALFETRTPDGQSRWQSGCAGRIEQRNGAQVATYVCRQRP